LEFVERVELDFCGLDSLSAPRSGERVSADGPARGSAGSSRSTLRHVTASVLQTWGAAELPAWDFRGYEYEEPRIAGAMRGSDTERGESSLRGATGDSLAVGLRAM